MVSRAVTGVTGVTPGPEIREEKTMTTVRAWLAAARATDDPEGDLIADMRRDSDLPARLETRLARTGSPESAGKGRPPRADYRFGGSHSSGCW
jgi:hypothetical protein